VNRLLTPAQIEPGNVPGIAEKSSLGAQKKHLPNKDDWLVGQVGLVGWGLLWGAWV